MRPAPAAAVLLLLLAAACQEPQVATIVHASDPHLLDYERPGQQELNETAWRALFDDTRALETDTGPHYLVLSGDFGLEAADPRVVGAPRRNAARPVPTPADSPGAPASADDGADPALARTAAADLAARADSVLAGLAADVAGQIARGAFDSVFFVPGNNDVVLEEADPAGSALVGTFADRVQQRLQGTGKQFIDLTRCYRQQPFDPTRCPVEVAGPYVLVGFPSVSLKNQVDSATYANLVPSPSRPFSRQDYLTWRRARERQQDALHQRLMGQFARAVQAAAQDGERRVVVVTHIPDLDDPYVVGQRAAAVTARDSFPRLGRSGPDAWNATDEVFRAWRAAVNSPAVAGVLAGHFHDSHREAYYRPYPWSNAIDRADRWRTFVTPPLAVKMQEASPFQARGFSVLRLGPETIRRRLYWYDREARQFTPDPTDERPESGGSSDGADKWLSPAASGAHFGLFLLVVGACIIARILWPPAERTYGSPPWPEESQRDFRELVDEVRRNWRDKLIAIVLAALALLVALAIIDVAFETGLWVWGFAWFWFVSLLVLGFILGLAAAQYRRLNPPQAEPDSDPPY